MLTDRQTDKHLDKVTDTTESNTSSLRYAARVVLTERNLRQAAINNHSNNVAV